MKPGVLEYCLIGAVVLLAILLFANRGCSVCKNRLAAISGAWPGAGTGPQVRPTDAAAE